jgi:hypothetical protein
MEWLWITQTQCALEDEGHYVRAINVREPYVNEPDGTKYVVTGAGHEMSVHDCLAGAKAAAEASLGA